MTATALPAVPAQGRLALWALFLGAVLISFSGIFVKLSELGPTATGFHRMFLALPVFWLWMAGEARASRTSLPARLDDWWLLAFCGLALAADLVVWHWSLHMTSVANATLLGNTAPIFVTLAGWLLFGQRFSPLFLLGLALGILGAVLLVGVSFDKGERPFLGDLLGIMAGAFYAAYLMLVGRLRGRLSTATVMGVSGVVTCIALLPVAYFSGEGLTPHSLQGWAMLFGLAWLSQVAGQSAITWSLAHLPTAFGALSLLVNPVAAALFAWLLLAERIEPLQGLGGVIVLGSIFLARQGSIRNRGDK
jgi:drug/metabolite transporter (DMT)-like permease